MFESVRWPGLKVVRQEAPVQACGKQGGVQGTNRVQVVFVAHKPQYRPSI